MNGKFYQEKEMDRIIASYPDGNPPDWEINGHLEIGKVMEAFKVIVDYGNVMGRKPEQLAEILGDMLDCTHRTLQQGVISALINVIVNYADARCDGRNEYSVLVCKKIKQALHDEGFLHGSKGDTYSAPLI